MIDPETWAAAKPLLEEALEHQDTHSIIDVYRALEEGDAQLWCADKSCIVTEILEHPHKRVARIWLAAGNRFELVSRMLPDIENWARDLGCDSVEVVGRKGWKRVLPDYTQPHTILEKSL